LRPDFPPSDESRRAAAAEEREEREERRKEPLKKRSSRELRGGRKKKSEACQFRHYLQKVTKLQCSKGGIPSAKEKRQSSGLRFSCFL